MKLLCKENPRTIALQSSSHSLTFRQISGSSKSKSEQPKVEVHLQANQEISRENGYKSLLNREVFGCLGLINVHGQIYVALITGASINVARPLPYESVDKIHSVDFFSLSSNEWDFVNLDANGMLVPLSSDSDDYETSAARVAHPCFDFKKLLSNGSFYYSNDFDLTSLLQARGVNQEKLEKDTHPAADSTERSTINVQHYQEQYMWNSFLMEDLLRFRANLDDLAADILNENRFLTTVIRGFAKTVRLGGSRSDTISIISKQSWKRAGTRFNARGIDDDGNVANFVETEFIYNHVSANQVFSFTQIRGSVPAFWEQDSTLINPKITVTRSREATQPSFDKHFTEVCDKYGDCHIINLLSKSKSLEVEISRRYTELLRHSDHREALLYSPFDFHAETKPLNGGFAGATKILSLLRDSLESFGWYDYNTRDGEVMMRQSGVFRVNCLDCLDRTNLIEQVICQTVVEHIVHDQDLLQSTRDRMRSEEFVSKHNELWADNGDAISQIYTGTNALKSSFTRSGKMNLAGALSDVTKSVSRMYQNTFVDSKKQNTMDRMLGKDGRLSIPVQIFDPISEFVAEKLSGSQNEFTTYDRIAMFTGTYNVNAAAPRTCEELLNWLFPPENASSGCPDIYAIGLQEIIELNAGSILAADNTRPTQWAKILQQMLNSQCEEFLLLRTESIASMCLFFFVKKSKISQVTEVSGSSKKTGMGGIAANKGACAVRFEYGATSFALVTSHFAAGVNATIERHNDYAAIMLGLSFTRNYRIDDHDNVIWFGDLNYRLNLSNDRCRQLLNNGAFDEMQQVDQLLLEKGETGGPFHQFKESRILFYPTYKFDKGTSNYDTSEKQRVPSWTDRILFRSKKGSELKSINYNAVMDIFLSDHKPVYSTFTCKVKFVDEKKKKSLALGYYNAYKSENKNPPGGLFENSSPSSSSTSSTFKSETMSELNLLDFDDAPPSLPMRSHSLISSIPRRVPPPPPASRRVITSETSTEPRPLDNGTMLRRSVNESKNQIPGRTQTPTDRSRSVNVPALPSRDTPTRFGSLAFDSAPLSPSNSMTSQSPSPSRGAGGAQTPSSAVLKPLKPSKPQSLSSTKLDLDEAALTGEKKVPVSFSSEKKVVPPPPPPARTTPKVAMSDWKPLIPQ
ncbi:hypothetical protein METBIDRAFT_30265 [Metschnikowia bicuspidata var. bicuspidata NRRL YB-4993]|uniref:phosphoinositide 5-phosphatase n=1 Tax=Metschnikowia bicuspidata var. bicuspidata NRRL YB-4993 TaxID=869754 RepID=A0A1A0HIQ8_9ASCO|nr:hypothetical protein METBIDRAFT_30265 [Metschnikowia bicuspidata var. bicuspidata NRRL YB-4993]OBA23895.1 hypothetical protein METBIDRAFT_30265 [Metschnikowia bicuspidata var. bicuspidata NRRL YB-4993]